MQPTEIVRELAVVLSSAAVRSEAMRAVLLDLRGRLTAEQIDDGGLASDALQACIVEAARLLLDDRFRSQKLPELGSTRELRHVVTSALQYCLFSTIRCAGFQCRDIGWSVLGERLIEIDAPVLLAGPLDSLAEASRWTLFAVRLFARICEERKCPMSADEDDTSDCPPTAEELDELRRIIDEFCWVLDVVTLWIAD